MATVALSMGIPKKITLAATYQSFSVAAGRNVNITCGSEFYLHPSEKDGTAVDATEQFKFQSGSYSLRLPKSGCGKEAVNTPDTSYFSVAAVSGTPDIWLWVVGENI